MGVLPLAVAARPCLCQMAVGRVKMGWAAAWGADLSFQEAAMRREGDMVGVAGPAMSVHNNNSSPIDSNVNIDGDDDGNWSKHSDHNHNSNLYSC